MPVIIENSKKGFTISFQTRGVDFEVAQEIWKNISPEMIKKSTEKTGHCLIVLIPDMCVEIKRTDWGNYTVWCGKYTDEEL